MKVNITVIIMIFTINSMASDNVVIDQYFSRTMVYLTMGEQIALVDPNKPRVITLDPWSELDYQLADGEHTVDQAIEYLSSQYDGNVPKELKKTFTSVVEKLVNEKILKLTSSPVKLPCYLAVPKEKQYLDMATKAMIEDGYIK